MKNENGLGNSYISQAPWQPIISMRALPEDSTNAVTAFCEIPYCPQCGRKCLNPLMHG